ncbi:MAG: hypothetical protein OXU74_14125 [Gemmatimonadota bacterium]|nr:hypothetical protein [Gemmatimonadota bacterium]
MDHDFPSRGTPRFAGTFLVAVAATVLASAVPGGELPGQQLDRGRFRLFLDGSEMGTEDFAIQRIGSGEAQETLARGAVRMNDGRVVTTILRTVGPAMAFSEYEAIVRGADTLQVRVLNAGDRLRRVTVAPWGEEEQEFRASPRTMIFDAGVAHHYFVIGGFLARGAADTTLHAFEPRSEREDWAADLDIGSETITLEGEQVEATRVRIVSGDQVRTVWFDGSGRLVRVEVPTDGFVAQREYGGLNQTGT